MTMRLSDNQLTRILGGLLSLALLSPLFFWPTFYLPFSSPTLLGFLLCVELALPIFLFLAVRRNHLLTVFRKPIILALVGFTAILVLTSFTGVDPFNSFLGTLQRPVGVLVLIHGLIFVLACLELFAQDPRWKSRMMTLVIVMAVVISLYALGELHLWPSFTQNEERAASLLGNPVFLASFLILPCFWSFARAMESKKYQLPLTLAGILLLLGILQTGTRGAIVGLLAGIIVLASLLVWSRANLGKHKRRIILSLGGLILALGLVGWAASPTSVFDRLKNTNDENITMRLTYWNMAFNGWIEYPLVGVGPGNFYVIADERFTPDLYAYTTVWPDKPHNTFLEYLSTSGLIGTFVWIGLLFFLARRIWSRKQHPASNMLLAGLVAYVVQGLFFFDGISDYVLFAFFIAYVNTTEPPKATINQSATPFVAGGVGILLMLVGLISFTLPLGSEASQAGRGLIPQTWIVVDDLLVSQTAFTRATEESEHQLENISEAIEIYNRSIIRHPLRQSLWNDLAYLYYMKAVVEGQSVEESGLLALQRAADLAPGRREAAYVYRLMQEHQATLSAPSPL